MTKIERNKAIYECHKKGITQTIIGEIFSIAQSTVNHILKSAKIGVFGPKEEKRGAKSKLTDDELENLKTILAKSPSNYGYISWNKRSIKDLIKKEFAVEYHENYIWYIMKCINFSSQLPQVQDYRKDQEKVDDFKEKKAPEIKKKQRLKIDV